MNNHEMDTHNGEALASRTPDSDEGHERTTAEAAEPVNVVSIRKIEANRANAQKSTGPRTDAGKSVSRMNAVTHALLAQAVVITAGDYHEDEQAFAELLDGLRDEFRPVSVAEDLEVQTIARCYWRKMRATRYEHSAIRKRTGDMRAREESSRENSFEYLFEFGGNFEESSRGIQCLIGVLERAKRELRDGTLKGEAFTWLEEQYPHDFHPPTKTEVVQLEDRRVPTMDYRDKIVATIDGYLGRLAPLHARVEETEELNIESKIGAAALPASGVVNKLIRYETSNDRQLDRAIQRLEAMQARRRKQGDAPADK